MKTKAQRLNFSLALALLLLGGMWLLADAHHHVSAGSFPRRPAAPQATGGPDAFGYIYTDSLTTPGLYQWVDIAASGTPVGLTDADTARQGLTLPTAFTFYDETHNQIYVTTNGYATFRSISASDVVTQCNPAKRRPPDTLAAFCTDLLGDTVYYSTTTAYNGHQTFIIQYNNVTHTVSGLAATFQIILDLEDQSITYQYLSIPTTAGVTTTVGLVGYAANHADYLTYCRGTDDCPPQDGMAVRYRRMPQPVLGAQLTPSDAFPDAGDTLTYTLVLSNVGDAAANGAVMTNVLPGGLDYVSGTLQASDGTPTYRAASRTARWDGDLPVNTPVTLTYATALNTDDYIYNTAVLSHPQASQAVGTTSGPADTWDDPQPLDAAHVFANGLGARRYIATDANGVPHIAYAGDTGLHYATLSGTTWLSETVPGAGYNLFYAALVLDDQNHAHIAFQGEGQLRIAEQISDSTALTWTVSTIADNIGSWAFGTLDLQQGSDGQLHLVYDYDDAEHALYYTTDTDWLTPTLVITEGACDLDDGYALALDANDIPHVACEHSDTLPRQVRLYTATLTAPWHTYEVVTSSDTSLYYYPSLAYDGDTPHLAFFQSDRALYHAQRDGSAWETTRIDDSVDSSYLRQGTALDTAGGQLGVVAEWRAGGYGNYTMTVRYVARPLTGTVWTTEKVSTLTYESGLPNPTLALDGQGQAHLAYYDCTAETLRYAAQVSSRACRGMSSRACRGTSTFTSDIIDQSRVIRSAAVALDENEAVHVAWDSKGLRYAVSAAGTTTWTRQIAVTDPGIDEPELSLAVDGTNAPHLAYGQEGAPLYHAHLSGTTWITRWVDAPGSVDVHPDIGAEVSGTAHIAYMAATGSELAVRHAAFDGVTWVTETLAIAGPDDWDHEQSPRLVAQGGKVYVLYADCTAYQDGADYPIDLVLKTWDGAAWRDEVLDSFVGQCNWNLDYQLTGDANGRLAAVLTIGGDAVRPSPLVKTLWINAGGTRGVQSPMAPSGGMSSEIIRYLLRGEGWVGTLIRDAQLLIQQRDRAGYASETVLLGEDRRATIIQDSAARSSTSVVVEQRYEKNILTVPRARRERGLTLPTLTLSGGSAQQECADQWSQQEVTILDFTLSVDEWSDWEVQTVQFQSSGAGHEVDDLQEVRLYKGAQLLSTGHYAQDDGTLTLDVGQRIPAGDDLNLSLKYVFKEMACGLYETLGVPDPHDYQVTTQVAQVNAEPVAYPAFVKQPPTLVQGELVAACAFNENTNKGFPIIQSAIDDDDTADGHVINVCPGIYIENVGVDKSLTIHSMQGRDVTLVEALSSDDHVFHVTQDDTAIVGFTIKQANGSDAAGIYVHGSPVHHCTLAANTLMQNTNGVALDGAQSCHVLSSLIYSNTVGVHILGGAQSNLVGGVETAQRNVISGNSTDGIWIKGQGTDNNRVQGNYIGTTKDGMSAHPNGGNGVTIGYLAQFNLIGGPSDAEGNLISGNTGAGVWIGFTGLEGSQVLNNIIGADKLGQLPVPNTNGIVIADSRGNEIGGDAQGTGNIIKGNRRNGLVVQDETYQNAIRWNDINQNGHHGIYIQGSENLVHANIVSGNGGTGIELYYADNNRITGNKIGTNETGTLPDPNGEYGIVIDSGEYNVIGGADATARNLIAGNEWGGVWNSGYGNEITGNYIGTREDGTGYLRNLGPGVKIDGGGANYVHDNLISGNQGFGVEVDWDGVGTNYIRNNLIGTDESGAVALPNLKGGVGVNHNAVIKGNTISGNQGAGVTLTGDGNRVTGNRIGTDKYGHQALGNSADGLLITGCKNTVADNMVSGNGECGVRLYAFDASVRENKIVDNYIGRSADGRNLGNTLDGIYITGASGNVIASNKIWFNCRGIRETKASNAISNNDIQYNTCNTGIHLDEADGEIVGNVIRNDASDAIHCDNGAAPNIYKNHIAANQGDGILSAADADPLMYDNNILANSGYGVRNITATHTLSAPHNWWGDMTGPGGVGPGAGDEVSAYVDYGQWRTQAISMIVVAEQDQVPVVVGQTGSNGVGLNNFATPSDTLTVVVTDTLGWLSGPDTFTVALVGALGSRVHISLTVPATVALGTIDDVQVTATSQSDPSASDRDTFQVEAVPPCIAPQSVAVTGPLTATVHSGTRFSATVTPMTHTLNLPLSGPVTYIWEASGRPSQTHVLSASVAEDTAAFTWVVSGSKTITVTVRGPCGGSISDTTQILVQGQGGPRLYLPLVLRD